jgi:hypothetical protein
MRQIDVMDHPQQSRVVGNSRRRPPETRAKQREHRRLVIGWLNERYRDFAHFNATWQTPAQSWQAFAALARVTAPYRRDPPYERRAVEEEAANRANPPRAGFAADCDAFAGLVAERYFALARAAIKTGDPITSCSAAASPTLRRAASSMPPSGTATPSLICYDLDPSAALERYAVAGKPCLIGEFSFRAADSGLPNTNGAGPLVPTQAERAACFRRCVPTVNRCLSAAAWALARTFWSASDG